MKKVKKVIMTLLPSTFVLALVLPISMHLKPVVNEAGEDTAIYSDLESGTKDFSQPDFHLGGDDDDDDDEPFIAPNKVRLHYYNESGVTGSVVGKQRAFYIWANGVDGIEINRYENNVYDPSGEGDENIIYSVNDEGTMMTLDIDYSKPLFDPYKGKSSLMFIIKFEKISASDLNWGGQSEDTQLSFRTFPPKDGITEVWAMSSGGNGITIVDSYNKTQVHGVKKAEFTNWKTIHCDVTNDTKRVDWRLYAFDETYFKIKPKKRADYEKNYLVKEGSNSGSEFDITLKYEAHINMVYSLVSHDPESDSDPDMAKLDKTAKVSFEDLYYTDKFHTYYEDKNKDVKLGMFYTPQATTFRVWSPIAANMSVLIYEDGTPVEYGDSLHPGDDKAKGFHMNYLPGGVWEVTITGDLNDKYYNLQVDNVLGTNVTMDPYATSSGVCGVRGYIYDKNSSAFKPGNSGEWDAFVSHDFPNPGGKAKFTPQDLSIYEVHVQDLTSDESWISSKSSPTPRGTYNAFVEKGTHLQDHSEITTGYDHLNELGINAVQLTPVFDHDNDERPKKMKYNWGYNPLNYNIPEGGYSSDPYDGAARVKEFRNLVLQMYNTDVHTRVIMDVVYNHVSSASASNFNKLMPRYYYRYARANIVYPGDKVKEKGDMYDGSGCSNEVASERPMMRKFIVESLCMWAKDYGIKGFRFDLMGLIDYVTLQEAQKALYEIDPTIYMYGESWTGSSYEHTETQWGGYHGEGSKEWHIENPGKTAKTFGAYRTQIFEKNDPKNFSGKAVYLGAFNDKTRDAIRGENNSGGYPGAGVIQNGNLEDTYNGDSDHNNIEDVVRGLWGNNHTYDDHYDYHGVWGWDPKQSVNYLSCHDNFTLRDQLYNTLESGAPASANILVRASIAAHALVFAGNSPAFMQGGEELFRTKELTEITVKREDYHDDDYPGDTPEERAANAQAAYERDLNAQFTDLNIKPTDCALLHGHWITHNSYNTPAHVNAFKWGNKLSLTFEEGKAGENTVNVSESGTNHMSVMSQFKKMIKMHTDCDKKEVEENSYKGLLEKASKTDAYGEPYTHNYPNNGDGAAIWEIHGNGGVNKTSVCFTVNHLVVYINTGHYADNTGIDARGRDYSSCTWTRVLSYGDDGWGDESGHTWLKMPNRFAVVIFDTHGDVLKS